MARASCGCLIEDGLIMHGYDGPCAIRADLQVEPTIEDYCASGDHGYAGDDGDAGRCYCGHRSYPLGGPQTGRRPE